MKTCLVLSLAVLCAVYIEVSTATAPSPYSFGPPPPPPPTPPTPPQQCGPTVDCDCVWSNCTQFGPCGCDGIQNCTQTLVSAATGNGTCDVPTAKVNDTRILSRSCTNPGCGPTPPDPCVVNGTNYCTNGGICYLQSQGTVNQPACKCPGNRSGDKCETQAANDVCQGFSCVNGTCYRVNNTATCECNAGWFGAACDHNPCFPGGNAVCKNGATCSISANSPVCDCTSTTCGAQPCIGTYCNETNTDLCTGPNAPNCNTGTCVNNFGIARCQCPQGFSGDNCQTTAKLNSVCDSIQTMDCVLATRSGYSDPTLPEAKCAAYLNYATCANKFNCTDMLSTWCATTFARLPSCTIAACAPPQTPRACNTGVYQQCYGLFRKQLANSSYSDPCAVAVGLTKCAAAARCNDLLRAFCSARQLPQGQGTPPRCSNLPPECSNINLAQAEDVDILALAGLVELDHDAMNRRAPMFTVVAGVVAAMAVVVLAAVVVVRRSRAAVSQQQPAEELLL